jgi:hypothetical protein
MMMVISNVKRRDDTKVNEDELRQLLGLTSKSAHRHLPESKTDGEFDPQQQHATRQAPSTSNNHNGPSRGQLPASQQQYVHTVSTNADDVMVIELSACDSIGLESVVNVICSRTMGL